MATARATPSPTATATATAITVLAATTALLAGCASLPAAQMALPAPLAAATPEPIAGIGLGREGRFTLGDAQVQFRRGRDRLTLFDLVGTDRSPVGYTLTRAEGRPLEASCRGRQTTLSAGVLQGHARPFSLDCRWQQPGDPAAVAELRLEAPSWMPGTRAERRGQFRQGGTTLELASVHQVQGSPLPLEQPIGYLLTLQGRPVGALELNGPVPRLWRPPAGDPLAEPVTLAALALALLWDPAGAGP